MLAAGRPLRASHRVAARRRRAAAPATPAAALRVAGGKLTSTRQSPKKQAAAIAKKQRVPGRLRWCRDPRDLTLGELDDLQELLAQESPRAAATGVPHAPQAGCQSNSRGGPGNRRRRQASRRPSRFVAVT